MLLWRPRTRRQHGGAAACPAAARPRSRPGPCVWHVPVKLIVSSARPMPHEETKALAISRHWPPPLAARR